MFIHTLEPASLPLRQGKCLVINFGNRKHIELHKGIYSSQRGVVSRLDHAEKSSHMCIPCPITSVSVLDLNGRNGTTGPPLTPPLPLWAFQQPVTLQNSFVAPGSYLQMSVSKDTPDAPIIETRQIGPDTFFAFEFNSTYEGKRYRFHFSFSDGDGSNNDGSQEVYALTSGSGTVDDKLTFNRPTSGESPIPAPLPSIQPQAYGDSLVIARTMIPCCAL